MDAVDEHARLRRRLPFEFNAMHSGLELSTAQNAERNCACDNTRKGPYSATAVWYCTTLPAVGV